MKPARLQINHRKNPLGIDDKKLRFTWNVDGGITQTAYRVSVKNEENEIVFDSENVPSSSMNCAADFQLKSRERYFWNVSVWDENGESEESETAWFEAGLFSDDWSAKWITSGLVSDGERLPADCFKTDFRLEGNVKRARLYATALGSYTAYVKHNGSSNSSRRDRSAAEKRKTHI